MSIAGIVIKALVNWYEIAEALKVLQEGLAVIDRSPVPAQLKRPQRKPPKLIHKMKGVVDLIIYNNRICKYLGIEYMNFVKRNIAP